jgi:hypothetical protein
MSYANQWSKKTEDHPIMSLAQLLAEAWRVWSSRAGMFVLLMGLPVAAILLMVLTIYFVILPPMDHADLRQVWLGLSALQRITISICFLATFAVEFRALAASVFAVQEIRSGRSVGFLTAISSVKRKQLRLFWMVMLASMLTGPFGFILFPLLSFAVAPGFPVAILENRPAFAAIQRGNALAKGRHGRIALLVAMWLGLSVASAILLISILAILQDRFGHALFLRPLSFLGFWIIFLIPQLYVIALTLNFLDQRGREVKAAAAAPVLQ